MRTHTWKIRVGLIAGLLVGSHAAVSAQSGPSDSPAPDLPISATFSPSKWGAPPIQFGGYVVYAALQALDVASTLQALRVPGAHEANPLYAGVVDSPAKFIALKSVTTFATILFMQRFSKSHPKASVFVMAGMNSGYLYVVNSNFRRASGH